MWRAETSVSYGTGGCIIYTTTLRRSCNIFLQDFQRVHLSSEIHEKGVHWGIIPKPPFMIRKFEQRRSLRQFTQTCVDHSRQLPQKNIGIMWYLLMIFQESVGFSSCRRNIRRYPSFVSSRHLSRRLQGRRWRQWGVKMVENTYLMNSRTFVPKEDFKENW